MSHRTRFQASSFGTHLSSSRLRTLRSSILPSYPTREASNALGIYSNYKPFRSNTDTVASDESLLDRKSIHSSRAKIEENKQFSSVSRPDYLKEGNQRESVIDRACDKDSMNDPETIIENKYETKSETGSRVSQQYSADNKVRSVNQSVNQGVNPLNQMEIKSAAQWREVSGRVSWSLEEAEQVDTPQKKTKGKRKQRTRRMPTQPTHKTR